MSKITPFLQQVVYLVANFLTSIEHTKQAQKLKKQFQLPEWIQKDNPLIKKGLNKVLKQYINGNQKVSKYFQNRKPDEDEQQESQPEVETPKPTKKQKQTQSPKHSPLIKPKSPKNLPVHEQNGVKPKGWMASQFQQPKRLQDLNDNDAQIPRQQAQIVIPKKDKKNHQKVKKKLQSQSQNSSQESDQTPKKKKKQIKKQKKEKKQKKAKGPVDSSYLNSEQQFQLEDKKAKKSITPQKKHKNIQIAKPTTSVVTRKKSVQMEEQKIVKVTQKVDNQYNNGQTNDNQQGAKTFFSRINKNEVGFIPQNRRNNTFEAKAKYGVGDAWGQFGHEKLKDTRGDSFKKTKGKLKNKAFQGCGININEINSVPIL